MKKLIIGYGSGEAIAKGLNIVLILGLATLVDVEIYGAISLLVAFELVLTEVVMLGQHTSLLRFYEVHRNSLARLYRASVLLILLATCTVILVYVWRPFYMLDMFAGLIADRALLFLILGVAIQCHFTLYLAYLRAVDKVWEYGGLRIGYQLVKIVAVGGAVLLVNEATAYPIGVCVGNALFFLVLLPRVNKETGGYRDIYRASSDVIKSNFLVGMPLALHTAVTALYSVADRFLLATMLDQKQLAIYSFASMHGSAIFFVTNVLALAYVPKIYRAKEFNPESRKRLMEFLLKAIIGTSVFAIVICFVVYPISLRFVPPEYAEGAVVLLLALASQIFQPITLYGVYRLTLLQNVVGIPVVTSCALLCNIILNWLLIPKFGIEGAALAAVGSQLIRGAMMTTVSHFAARRVAPKSL